MWELLFWAHRNTGMPISKSAGILQHFFRDANINIQKIERIQTKNREVFKITPMAENLPEIGRLPNLCVKMGQKCLQNREPPY